MASGALALLRAGALALPRAGTALAAPAAAGAAAGRRALRGPAPGLLRLQVRAPATPPPAQRGVPGTPRPGRPGARGRRLAVGRAGRRLPPAGRAGRRRDVPRGTLALVRGRPGRCCQGRPRAGRRRWPRVPPALSGAAPPRPFPARPEPPTPAPGPPPRLEEATPRGLGAALRRGSGVPAPGALKLCGVDRPIAAFARSIPASRGRAASHARPRPPPGPPARASSDASFVPEAPGGWRTRPGHTSSHAGGPSRRPRGGVLAAPGWRVTPRIWAPSRDRSDGWNRAPSGRPRAARRGTTLPARTHAPLYAPSL